MAEVAAKVAAAKGLKIKIVEFSDYGHVNEALAAKDIDVNAFQHVLYLNKAIAQKGYPFTPLGKTVLFPLGVYSLKIHSVNEITDGMLVTVPADPANLGRALQLLERNGLITLHAGTGVHATTRNIIANPKHLKFREVDSAYLGRSLPDVGFAVINGSWAVKSNLSTAKDTFLLAKTPKCSLPLTASAADPTAPSEPSSPLPTADIPPSIRINAWSAEPASGQSSAPSTPSYARSSPIREPCAASFPT